MRDKNVLITGAACGIGKGLAEAFAAEGANLILCDINEYQLEVVTAQIRSDYRIMSFKCDVSSEDQVLEMFNAVERQLSCYKQRREY